MYAFPADLATPVAGGVGAGRIAAPAAGNAMAGAALDASELFDVDVDELARALALVALGRLESQPAKAAHPDPREDPGGLGKRPASKEAWMNNLLRNYT